MLLKRGTRITANGIELILGETVSADILHKPKVGSTVRVIGDVLTNFNYTVLAIHGSGDPMVPNNDGPRNRRWAVIAHKDDIPQVVFLGRIECVV